MNYKVNSNRLSPKKESTFGKKPFKGKDKNRKGSKKLSIEKPELKCERIKVKVSSKNVHKVDLVGTQYMKVLKSLDLPCFCCGSFGSIELHHIKACSSDEKNHREVLPLCGDKCHRLGLELSAHGTPKKFREAFPVEIQRVYAAKMFNTYKKEML